MGDRYTVLDSMVAAAREQGWRNVGASTSEHWATLTVTDGQAGLREFMHRVSSANVSAHMTANQIAGYLSEHPGETVEINPRLDQATGLRTMVDILGRLNDDGTPKASPYEELVFAASEVVTAYDSPMDLGDWAARLENCMVILRALVNESQTKAYCRVRNCWHGVGHDGPHTWEMA